MRPERRVGEVTRLEALSDAVFGFSATLLVVSLEVPKTFPELVADLKGFGAFALSFATLILIWSVHNAFFRRYGLQDRTTVVLNSCLLFVVLFYVYPLKFVVEGIMQSLFRIDTGREIVSSWGELAMLFVLYSGGFVALFLCVALLYLHARRSGDALGLSAGERDEALVLCRHYLLFVLVGLLSVALSASRTGLHLGLPGMIYTLLGPLCWAHGAWSNRQARRRAAPAASA